MTLLVFLLGCASPPASPPAAPPLDPLAKQSVAQICADNGLSLIKWPYDTLAADFAGTCCGAGGLVENPACDLDWPFSDVPPCSAYDAMRNHIYARYGYDFKNRVYEAMFEHQPWYQQRADFDESWLSDVARANVAKLEQLKADHVNCSG